MSDRRYIVKKGSKVTIEINRRKVPSPKSQVSSPKGLMKLRREDDYQARRLSGVVLNFYDLGWKKVGADFEELSFAPVVTNQVDNTNPSIVQADYDNLHDAVFGVALDDFKTTFKNVSEFIEEFREDKQTDDYFPAKLKVQAGGVSSFQLFDIEDYAADEDLKGWNASGLKIPKSLTTGGSFVIEARLGNALNIFDLKANRITAEFDYDAGEVELPISGKLDIFLFPPLVLTNAINNQQFNTHITPLPPDAYYDKNYLDNAVIMSFRKMFYDRTDIDFAVDIKNQGNNGGTGEPPADITRSVNVLTNKISGLGNTYIRGETNPAPPPLYNESRTDGSASDFYNLDEPPVSGLYVGYQIQYFIQHLEFVHKLNAVIRKGENWYYVWDNP